MGVGRGEEGRELCSFLKLENPMFIPKWNTKCFSSLSVASLWKWRASRTERPV